MALHETWIERCTICHESTTETIRAEDHETLKFNAANVFNLHAELPPTLERHREKINSMSSDQLRAFLYEFYAIAQDIVSSSELNNHNLNSATHYRPDISTTAQEQRNAATYKLHQSLYRAQE